MQKRRISAIGTFFFKFCIPTISLLFTILCAADDWMFGIIPFIVLLLITSLTASLKRVWIEEDTLVISNYLKTIRVPIVAIACVSENFLINPKLICIVFKHHTPFGLKIKFTPIIYFKDIFSPFTSHSLVAELRALSQQSETASTSSNPSLPND